MGDKKISRKKFVRNSLAISSVLTGLGFLSGCSRKEGTPGKQQVSKQQDLTVKPTDFGDACDDLSNLSQSEIEKRDIYGYVQETSYPENRCDNCRLYIPPEAEGDCGGCILFEGPVFAGGYCDYWAPET